MFALAQVTMDLEVMLGYVLCSNRLHSFANTSLGTTVVLIVTVSIGKPLYEQTLCWWDRKLSAAQAKWLQLGVRIPWHAAWIGACRHLLLSGAYAVMQPDAKPWMPFSDVNRFVGSTPVQQVDMLCLPCVVIGILIITAYSVTRACRSMTHARAHS